jgi:hypothetical protein
MKNWGGLRTPLWVVQMFCGLLQSSHDSIYQRLHLLHKYDLVVVTANERTFSHIVVASSLACMPNSLRRVIAIEAWGATPATPYT